MCRSKGVGVEYCTVVVGNVLGVLTTEKTKTGTNTRIQPNQPNSLHQVEQWGGRTEESEQNGGSIVAWVL